MRIERSHGNSGEVQVAAALAAQPTGIAATMFTTALRQHQQRQVGIREEARQTDGATSRKTPGRQTAQRDSHGDKTAAFPQDEAVGEAAVSIESRRLLSMLPARVEQSLPASSSAAGHREIRRRRSLGDSPQSPCIEITHASTEGRFLLSRENGVWILSLPEQPAMREADLQSMLEMLRAHFTERGLGPIDIVV